MLQRKVIRARWWNQRTVHRVHKGPRTMLGRKCASELKSTTIII